MHRIFRKIKTHKPPYRKNSIHVLPTNRKFPRNKNSSRMRKDQPKRTETTYINLRQFLFIKPRTKYEAFRKRVSFNDLGMPLMLFSGYLFVATEQLPAFVDATLLKTVVTKLHV